MSEKISLDSSDLILFVSYDFSPLRWEELAFSRLSRMHKFEVVNRDQLGASFNINYKMFTKIIKLYKNN